MSFNNTSGLRSGAKIAGLEPPEPNNRNPNNSEISQDRHTHNDLSDTHSNITKLYNSDDISVNTAPSVLSTTGGTVRTIDPPDAASHRTDPPPSLSDRNQPNPQPRTASELSYQSSVPNSITTGTGGATRQHLQSQLQNVTARILTIEHGQEAHTTQLHTINKNFPPIMSSLARILLTLDAQQQQDHSPRDSTALSDNATSDEPPPTTSNITVLP